MTEKKTQTAAEADAEFDEAFNQENPTAAGGAGGGGDADSNKGKGGGGGEADADPNPAADDTDGAGDDGKKGKDGDPDAEDGDAEPAADDADKGELAKLRADFVALEQKTRSWEGRLSASDREKNTLKDERDALARKVAELETTIKAGGKSAGVSGDAEIDAELEKMKKEYPDFTPAVWGVIEKALKRSRAEVDTHIDKVVDERLKPLKDQSEKAIRDAHFNAIAEKHPDFKEIATSKELTEWIDSKPAYLRPGLATVLKQGTAAQVNELLADYKAETKVAADAKKAALKKAAEDKRKQQQEDAGAVQSRSGGLPAGKKDANDFDGAWNEAPD